MATKKELIENSEPNLAGRIILFLLITGYLSLLAFFILSGQKHLSPLIVSGGIIIGVITTLMGTFILALIVAGIAYIVGAIIWVFTGSYPDIIVPFKFLFDKIKYGFLFLLGDWERALEIKKDEKKNISSKAEKLNKINIKPLRRM